MYGNLILKLIKANALSNTVRVEFPDHTFVSHNKTTAAMRATITINTQAALHIKIFKWLILQLFSLKFKKKTLPLNPWQLLISYVRKTV